MPLFSPVEFEEVVPQPLDRDAVVPLDRGVDQIPRPIVVDEQAEIARLGLFHLDVHVVNRERSLRRASETAAAYRPSQSVGYQLYQRTYFLLFALYFT